MATVTINGHTYTDDANPTTGLGGGGHRARFIPLISDVVTVLGTVAANGSLTINRALASNASGQVVASSVTSTELGYLSGVTSALQTQLNAKAALAANNTFTAKQTLTGAEQLLAGSATGANPPGRTISVQFHEVNNVAQGVGVYQWSSSGAAGPKLAFLRSSSATSGVHGASSYAEFGRLEFFISDGVKFCEGARISAYPNGTVETDSVPGKLQFWTTATSESTPTLRMALLANGNLLIGTETDDASGAKLQVAGAVNIASGNAYKINNVQVVGARQSAIANASVSYTTGNLDTEAEIITALNTTNGKINSILTALRTHGLIAT